MIRSAIFDIDDTLYDYEGAHARAFGILAAEAARRLGVSEERFREVYAREMRWQFTARGEHPGSHSRVIRLTRVLEALGLSLRHAIPLASLYWDELIGPIRPADGAPELFDALRAHGVRIGIGSNMTAWQQMRKLETLGLLDRTDFVVTSEEAAAEKPAPAFFALCAEKAGCAPEECAFIGDNLERDALAASAAGMRGYWLQPDAARRAGRPDVPSVASLRDLAPVLLA